MTIENWLPLSRDRRHHSNLEKGKEKELCKTEAVGQIKRSLLIVNNFSHHSQRSHVLWSPYYCVLKRSTTPLIKDPWRLKKKIKAWKEHGE